MFPLCRQLTRLRQVQPPNLLQRVPSTNCHQQLLYTTSPLFEGFYHEDGCQLFGRLPPPKPSGKQYIICFLRINACQSVFLQKYSKIRHASRAGGGKCGEEGGMVCVEGSGQFFLELFKCYYSDFWKWDVFTTTCLMCFRCFDDMGCACVPCPSPLSLVH